MQLSILSLSSIPGLSHATQRKGLMSAIWTCIGLVGISLTCYLVSVVVKDYLNDPSTTTIVLDIARSARFPMVEVCSPQKVDCTNVKVQIDSNIADPMVISGLCQLHDLAKCEQISRPEKCTNTITNIPQTNHEAMELLMDQYELLPNEVKYKVSVQAGFLFLDCKFNGSDCKWLDHLFPYTPSMSGTCLNFNSNANIETKEASKDSALVLEVRLNPRENIYLTDQVGFPVIVQSSEYYPKHLLSTYYLAPGTSTTFSLAPIKRLRRPPRCYEFWNQTKLVHTVTGPWTEQEEYQVLNRLYDDYLCNELCQLESSWDHCKCIWRDYDRLFLDLLGIYAPPCIVSNETTRQCLESSKVKRSEDPCDCKPACTNFDFDIRHSFAKWPTPVRVEEIATSTGMNESEVITSVARIEVYIRSLDTEVIKEEAIYKGWTDLFKALGGALSFYMGLSFIMIFEIVEILIVLITGVCKRR